MNRDRRSRGRSEPLRWSRRAAPLAALAVSLLAPPAVRAQPHSPLFEMPSPLPSRTVGAELMVGTIDVESGNVTLAALELSGEFAATPRLALRALLPIAYANGQDFSGTTLGDLTLGTEFLLTAQRSGGSLSLWSLGGSMSLATASDGGESRRAAEAHRDFRVPYPGHYWPDTNTLRLHADYRLESGQVFFQGQLGVQFHVIEDVDDVLNLRLGLGGGAMITRHVALLAELTTISDILDDSEGENFLHVLELGGRFHVPGGAFGARFYLPLDDSLREGRDILGFAVDYRAAY